MICPARLAHICQDSPVLDKVYDVARTLVVKVRKEIHTLRSFGQLEDPSYNLQPYYSSTVYVAKRREQRGQRECRVLVRSGMASG